MAPRVLLAEDNDPALAALLTGQGMCVERADDGVEAMAESPTPFPTCS